MGNRLLSVLNGGLPGNIQVNGSCFNSLRRQFLLVTKMTEDYAK